jgi:hypothetical protein
MTEKELLEKLTELKEIKPNNDWASWLLNNIMAQKPENLHVKPRVKLVSFSFLSQYKKSLIPAAFVILFVSSFAFAQTTLPGNVLYPAKILTQNIRLALTPSDYKPVVRMRITRERLQDIAKVSDQEEAVASLTQNIKQDLNLIPQELKGIQKKQVALQMSQQVQNEGKNLTQIVNQTQLKTQAKEELDKSVKDTQDQVLALINQTTEQINQCPAYLQNQVSLIQEYFTDNTQSLALWPKEDILKVQSSLVIIGSDLQAGNCLEALKEIDSINQLMQIHSLDIKVETSTSGSSD